MVSGEAKGQKFNREKQLPSSSIGICRSSANAGFSSDLGFLTFGTLPTRENTCVDTSTSNKLKGSPQTTHTGQKKVCTFGPDSNRRPWESRSRTQNPKLNLVLPADRNLSLVEENRNHGSIAYRERVNRPSLWSVSMTQYNR